LVLAPRKDGYNEMASETFLYNPLCSRLVGLGCWGGTEFKMKTWEVRSPSESEAGPGWGESSRKMMKFA